MDNIKTMLRYVFQTKNDIVFVHHAAAHGANEAVIANLTERGDTIIIPVMGFFGDRLVTIAERYGTLLTQLPTNGKEFRKVFYNFENFLYSFRKIGTNSAWLKVRQWALFCKN